MCPAGLSGLSGPYLSCVLSLCPELVSCGPFWVVLALVRAVSSSCVLSLCPTINEHRRETRTGPVFFFFVYRPGACFWPFLASGPYLGSVVPFWLALALVRAGSSACVLSLCPVCLSGSFWPLFGLSPQPVSSACVLRAFLGRSGLYLGCVLSLCPQLVTYHQ